MKTITIAIPCYRSSNTIETVVRDIVETFETQDTFDYQIILVNDYPYDNTFSVIKELCRCNQKIIGLNLSRNFGQTGAKMAAIPYVLGDLLVFMDDDGQHTASGIFTLAQKVLEGYDVVYAYFKNKKHSVFKKTASKIQSKLSEINGIKPKGIHTSSFFALSKFAIEALSEYHSPFPSIVAYLHTLSCAITEIEIPHQERISGRSGYTLKKLWNLWIVSFTNFSVVPLRCMMYLGGMIAGAGLVMGIIKLILKLLSPLLYTGYTLDTVLLLVIGGVILSSLGFVGEYIGKIYMTLSDRKPYRIREAVNVK